MPHLSKRKIETTTKRLLIDSLDSLFTNLNKHDSKKVLSIILTSTEKLMIAKRIGASLLIREGVNELQISDSLKLSRETVYKFNSMIKSGDESAWNFVLEKLERWHEFSTLKEVLKNAGMNALKKFSHGVAGKI